MAQSLKSALFSERRSESMNTFTLKLIATTLMLVDHFAMFFLPLSSPGYWILRMIGRVSAPLFWFCFVEGFRRTSNKSSYIKRLALSALAMGIGNEIIAHLLALPSHIVISWSSPNMFLSFMLAGILLYSIEEISIVRVSDKMRFASLSALCAAALLIFAEYGPYVLYSTLCLYFVKKDTIKYALFAVGNALICLLTGQAIQIFMLLTVLFLAHSSLAKPKRNWKWFFYVFYPLHLWIFAILANLTLKT